MFYVKKQWLYNGLFCIALILSLGSLTPFREADKQVNATPLYSKLVVIDPGHGHPDGGAVGYNGSVEADINLSVSKKLGSYFQQSGAYVIYTRDNENAISDNLEDKIRNIKKADMKKRKHIKDSNDGDIFISIHVNKYEESKYKGAQVFYQSNNKESEELAKCIQYRLKDIVDPDNDRMVKDSGNSIFLLNNSSYPSVLVECGFISNPVEEKLLNSEEYQDKIAYSVFCGVMDFVSGRRY